MSSQGSPHTRYKRALATGNPRIATAAALELPSVLLEDALQLVLLYFDAGDPRYERAAVRWVGRVGSELPGVGLAGAAVALEALRAIARGERARGAEALAGVLESANADRLANAVDDWLSRGG